ncbi:hypothetical protein HHK36_017431 [Tetracentron sinense]|uniref:Uncharacterized protein n=1 Tax=Tetracentron sinense TaxID=13715 RepID=A0A834Z2H2_TETSI|nr:hypothetical protein HHK36_017431 [Tetracentron sinense]
MQTGKNAAASVKETASNIAASAKSGMDKTKATVQEKVERVTAHNPMDKDMATQHKQEKMNQAEMNKQEAREHNAAAKHTNAAGGTTGHSVGLHHTPAIPGQVTGGGIGSHPIGTATATSGTTAPNTHLGGGN